MDADSDEERLDEEYGSVHDVGYDARDDTAADERWDLGADRVYWRRRFLILCAGVIALGVCAWMIPGVNAPSERAAAQARQSAAALSKRQVPSAVAYGSAWASPTPTAPSAAPASTAPAKLANTKHAAPAGHPSPAPGAPGASPCAPSGIVLSLFTSQPRYARGARPAFSVYAVSTKAAACMLSFGAGAVQVIVTRGGHVVWDSAACRPAPAKAARFTLGVPLVLTLSWNPRATKPSGCGGSLPAGESGTFDAVAMSHGQASPVRAFKIAGLPAESGLERLAHVLHLGDCHARPALPARPGR